MADQFLFVFAALAAAAAVWGLSPRVDVRWLAVSGVLAMCATLSRSVGMAVVLGLAGVILIAASGPGSRSAPRYPSARSWEGLSRCLGVYVLAFVAVGGTYLGLGDMSGWNVYSRVAPFADCRQFTPPEGTAPLCEQRPQAQRPGPFGYVWDATSDLSFAVPAPRSDDLEATRQVRSHGHRAPARRLRERRARRSRPVYRALDRHRASLRRPEPRLRLLRLP